MGHKRFGHLFYVKKINVTLVFKGENHESNCKGECEYRIN